MATTSIGWTGTDGTNCKVWNPTRGCRRISTGCGGPGRIGGCYAEKMAYRFSGKGQPYEGLVQMTANGPRWTGVGRFVPDKLAEPLTWRKPCRIFVDSMSDLFFEAFTNEEIAAVFVVMAACPQHTFQLLTKRPKRMRKWFEFVDGYGRAVCLAEALSHGVSESLLPNDLSWPLHNVHLGVSCENQEAADERIPYLLQTPAAVRWVSAEPLLSAIDFRHVQHDRVVEIDALAGTHGVHRPHAGRHEAKLSWIVVGCESGRSARPADKAWFHAIAEQCSSASVPLFVKQMVVGGELCTDASYFPPGLQRQEFPR